MRPMRYTGPDALRHTSILLAGVLAAIIPLHLARADAQGEHAALARVIHELQPVGCGELANHNVQLGLE